MLVFFIFLILVIILNVFIVRSSKSRKPFEDFLQKQHLANIAPKKAVPDDLYITINKGNLPFTDYETSGGSARLARAQEAALKTVGLKMLKLPHGMENNDIKMAYGAGNFERVVSHEENYETCMRALIRWGEELLGAGRESDAALVLNEAIAAKTDISAAYALLRDCLVKQNDESALAALREKVSDEGFTVGSPAARKKIREAVLGEKQ